MKEGTADLGGFSFANHVKMFSNPVLNIRAHTQECYNRTKHPPPLPPKPTTVEEPRVGGGVFKDLQVEGFVAS